MKQNIKCSKCGRQLPPKGHTCLYCGAAHNEPSSSNLTHQVGKEGAFIVSETQVGADKLKDLPEHIQNKFNDAFRKGNKDVIIDEQRTIVTAQSANEKNVQIPVSMEKVVALLSKLKDSFEESNIEYSHYQRFVSNTIKDYITTLPEDMRLNFVIKDIANSTLSDFIDEEMLKDLRALVLSSASVRNS